MKRRALDSEKTSCTGKTLKDHVSLDAAARTLCAAIAPSPLYDLALLIGGVRDGNACGVQEWHVVGCVGSMVTKLGNFWCQ
jgi:hypothetical protein